MADNPLQFLDTQAIEDLSELRPAELKPYAVMLVEIQRKVHE